MSDTPDRDTIMKALAEPFDSTEVRFKPQAVNGGRALALAYIDARLVAERLDDVLGVEGWQDDYEPLPDGSVVCRLRLKIGGEWITKVDVGGPSEQPDGGDRLKAAFSDALKRAAVKFGIGRYLYRLPQQWVDYDAQRRQFKSTPQLPAFALPGGKPAPKPVKPAKPAHAMPANGAELLKRLTDYEAKLVSLGVCEAGALLAHVAEAGEKAGHGKDLASWTAPAISLAVEETKVFEAAAVARRGAGPAKEPDGVCIDKDQARQIADLLIEARITKPHKGKNGQPQTIGNWAGIFAHYQIGDPMQLPLCHFTDCVKKVKDRHPSILPPEKAEATKL